MAEAYELANNETEVKTYHCTQLKFPPCAGYLTITNKRVIFHGFSSSLGDGLIGNIFDTFTNSQNTSSRIVNDVKIDTISGMSSFYGAKVHARKVVIGLLFVILAIVLWATARTTNWYSGRQETSGFRVFLGIVAAVLAGYNLIKSFRRTFFLKIYSSQTTGAISIGETLSGMLGNSAVFSLAALPTSQTDQMMKELSAMVLDIQALGDRGAEKWTRSTPQKQPAPVVDRSHSHQQVSNATVSSTQSSHSHHQSGSLLFIEDEIRNAFEQAGYSETGVKNELHNPEMIYRVTSSIRENTKNGSLVEEADVEQLFLGFTQYVGFTFKGFAYELSKLIEKK